MLTDSHCHLDQLDLAPFNGHIDLALDAARKRGVSHFLCVCIDMNNFPAVLRIAEQHADVSASVGNHPNEQNAPDPTFEELIHHAAHPKVVALGETGLDYFRSEGDLTWQWERFRRHIRAAKETGKPLIVHTRNAGEDTLKLLQEENAQEVGGVLHCFTDSLDIAERALAMNFYISISGIVTFKKAETIHEVAKKIPLDRLLIETDSPYLAPNPYRGKPNQPAYVVEVAECVAQLRGVSMAEIASATTANFFKLFKHARKN